MVDLAVREDGVTIHDSHSRQIDALLDNIMKGTYPLNLTLDSQVLRGLTSHPELAGRFCRALYAREEGRREGLPLLRQVLQQCGEEQDTFAEGIAGSLVERESPGIEKIAHLFARLFVNLGFLRRRWGPHLKHLLLSGGDAGFPENAEERELQAQEGIAELYAHARWQSLDPARRFLQYLRSMSGELVYGGRRLLKLEGVDVVHGEHMLRWWCGERREKGLKMPSWVYISLKEVAKILPKHLRITETLCLTATLQRGGAYGVLGLPEQVAERVDFWGCLLYQSRREEYGKELRRAEETFAQQILGVGNRSTTADGI